MEEEKGKKKSFEQIEKCPDLHTSHPCHFKMELQRLCDLNVSISEELNHSTRTAVKRSNGFISRKYRNTNIYVVAGGLR